MQYDLLSTYYDANLYGIAEKEIRKGRRKKLERKVSCYRCKNAKISEEIRIGNMFASNIAKSSNSELYNNAYKNLIRTISMKRKKDRHKVKDLKNGYYMHCRLNSIILKNRYLLNKYSKYDNVVLFYREDVYEYICILFQAKKEHKLKEFLDVPDVSYVTRNLCKTGIDIYFK